ncbi:galactoside 2-alpha-L-fucosyltransferase-like [Impatiens glandulifera]|uniref:galactoside 2-alpha-L-fucosyltransferase-like n=1 Tax=Impatiens glandulifera TaxID=253017 RepID=UPI001FB19D00|nr:galactoside 2-alpha-L-fucosyltransferase-like [Impatiens glandulifera]
MHEDVLLGGLLEEESNKGTCISKRESALYRKPSPHKPSPYLISRLRKYEAMHRKCGPNSSNFDKAVKRFSPEKGAPSMTNYSIEECKYLIWIPSNGLGNRLVSIVSAFLYALLTNRVFLIDEPESEDDLLCEPFENTTWLLPPSFPPKIYFTRFHRNLPNSYGNTIKNMNTSTRDFFINNASVPPLFYLHQLFDCDDHDMLFYCDDYQLPLKKTQWLVLRSDEYFAPSLFLMPAYEQELSRLFPKKDKLFHHLSRYLFHPSNVVWGLVKRYYDAYFSGANEKIGIQIRDFKTTPMSFKGSSKRIFSYYFPFFARNKRVNQQIRDICSVTSMDAYMMDRIVSCLLDQGILPKPVIRNVPNDKYIVSYPNTKPISKAVMVASLSLSYYDNISNMYWEQPTENGEVIRICQPSHENSQHNEKMTHNMKAWAEIYLLSLMDVLIISPFSTFGYVAQGLSGKKVWMINSPHVKIPPTEPSCVRAKSPEPCFHSPPYYDCKAKYGVDPGSRVPYVQHCEDLKWGIKLVDGDDL